MARGASIHHPSSPPPPPWTRVRGNQPGALLSGPLGCAHDWGCGPQAVLSLLRKCRTVVRRDGPTDAPPAKRQGSRFSGSSRVSFPLFSSSSLLFLFEAVSGAEVAPAFSGLNNNLPVLPRELMVVKKRP